MIKNFLLLITVLFTVNGFADLQKNRKSDHSNTIYSPTESYTILQELGEGAFGKVYAVENSAGKRYAIKTYKSHTDVQLANHILANAQREYLRGQALNHSNIVKTFDLFEGSSRADKHATYLVLELVEGKTIFSIPKRSLELNHALHSSVQLIDALRYALSQNLFYLDLHANNIMLANSFDTMIVDLASFYSIEELFNFATQEEEEKEDKAKTVKDKKARAKHVMMKEKKLKRFFLNHPKLLKKFQNAKKKNKDHKTPKNKNADIDFEEPNQQQMMPLFSYYFDSITEICIQLILKSDLSREEKLRLRSDIKMLAWNYSEDIEDDLIVPIDYYFEQLIEILKS